MNTCACGFACDVFFAVCVCDASVCVIVRARVCDMNAGACACVMFFAVLVVGVACVYARVLSLSSQLTQQVGVAPRSAASC